MSESPDKLSQFWQELKRRKILPFLIGYVAACFAIIEFFLNASETFSLPEETIRLLYLLSAIGIPLVILFPWYINRKKPVAGIDESGMMGLTIKSDKSHIQDNSIIVLPFENISPDPDQEYFSDGLTEEIITDLSYIEDLLVISRSSAMTFKGTNKTLKEVTNEVNVRYALEGSVRKAGNNIRIIAQLIDGTNDSHIWAEKYSGTLDDIFNIQERVSRSIADALRIRLSPVVNENLSKQPVNNLEVYTYYLKARQEIYRLSEEGLDNAIRYLEKGLQVGGESPLLYSCMGNAYYQYWNLGIRLDDSFLVKAKDCSDRIFQLEPGSYHGRMILGLLRSFSAPQEAIREFELVLTNDPLNEDALLWLSIVHIHLGLSSQNYPLIDRLERKDPLNSIVKVLPGLRFYYQGELELALNSFEKAYRSDTNDPVVLWHYGRTLASCNDPDLAVSILDHCTEMGKFGIKQFSQLFSLALQGKNHEVVASISPDIDHWAKKDWQISLWLAEVLSLIGESVKAIEYLEQVLNLGGINYPFFNEHDVFLTSIRSKPEFQQIVCDVEAKYKAEHKNVRKWLEENDML
ncbi:MAG: hypothetical protein KAI99_04695 [Cyclobacteriaceae bacterium]|nr:hypothetical protein [Cyclobacteriaceae bacterium]MCK5703543.1 hypothetical protein [Cyclobacteriaceae bacterium]